MRRRLFARLTLGSMQRRWRRTTVAIVAVALAGGLVSAAVSVATGIGERAGRALRAYGANIVVLPGDEGLLPVDTLVTLKRIPSAEAIQGVVPLRFGLARVGATPVVLVGTDLAATRTVNSWWQLQPDVRTLAGGPLAVPGVNLAQVLKVKVGDDITVRVGVRRATMTVTALLSTGGAEDNQLLVDLALSQRLVGTPGLSVIYVSALSRSGDISGIIGEIGRALPDFRVQSIQQIARAEERVLQRVELLLGLIAIVAVLVAGISVSATMSALALERRGEVALMKAIGADDRTVSRLFILEAGGIGLGGGLVGFGLGWLLAQLVSRAMQAPPIPPSGLVFLITIASAYGLATISSLLPVRRALAVEPAIVLRGE